MKAKFQPTPSSTSAAQKCATERPETATTAASTIIASPMPVMRVMPKRAIRLPVMKLGPNMPSTCH